jgi:hypothetical protein
LRDAVYCCSTSFHHRSGATAIDDLEEIDHRVKRVSELPKAGVTGAVDGKQLTKLVLGGLVVTIGSRGVVMDMWGREGRGTLLWSGSWGY